MPKDIIADARVEVIPGGSVTLPSQDYITSAEMTREGADLRLTLPDGHSFVVEGYFAQELPPNLVAADGARLTPQLIDSFLLPSHPGQYAAAGQSVNDASPSGRVTAVTGEAHIVRADGTRVEAKIGTPVHQGDVIETAKTGAVNIIFADNTAFAVSENARLSIDKFVYDPGQHSGTSFFAMLQGAFVYTSGLIGKDDPGNVNIETPVGTIGIRGTAAVGDLAAKIFSVWEGAINIHDSKHGVDALFDHRYKTFAFSDTQPPQQLDDMNPKEFVAAHPTLFSVVDERWLDPLIDIYQQLHPGGMNPNDLPMPEIKDGKLDLQHDDSDSSQQTWGLADTLQLQGGSYGAWSGAFPAGIPTQTASSTFQGPPIVGNNTDDIFYIDDSNTQPGPGLEFVPEDSLFFDGGNGEDTIILRSVGDLHILFDTFTLPQPWQVLNVENIVLGASGNPAFGHHASLDLAGVFAMTDSDHILHIVAHEPSNLTSFVDVELGVAAGEFSSVTVGTTETTYTGLDATGTQTVTLVITTAGNGVSPVIVTSV